MFQNPLGLMLGGAGLPDEGEVELARIIGANNFAALSNHVTGGATVTAHVVAPYTPITSPLITRKSSGIFLVWATVTISINGGTMAAADAVTYQGLRVTPGAVALNPIKTTAAISGATGAASGYTVVADLNIFYIDTPGIAAGATASYGIDLTGVDTTTHTSGVIATTDGTIVVIELPG
jgi:hypothetical protein